MCRKNKTAGLALLALGVGLLTATIFPRGFIVFIVGTVLAAVGAIMLTRP